MSTPTHSAFCSDAFVARSRSGGRTFGSKWLLLAISLLFCLGTVQAQAAQVPQGGYGTFAGTTGGSFLQGWAISRAGSTVATNSSPAGWSVSYSSPNFTVTSPSNATIATNYTVQQANITATFDVVAAGAAALASVSISPATITQGSTATGTIILSALAPAGNFPVSLSSSNSTLVSVPATVSVAAGTNSQTFSVTTSATAPLASPVTITITATAGAVTKTATFTLNPRPKLTMISPSVGVTGGSTANFRATLDSAPLGGTLTLSLSSNLASATPPATVTVASGSTTADFGVTTTAVASQQSGTITATLDSVSKTGTITVYPPAVPDTTGLTLSPSQLTGGGTVSGTINLTGPAPTGGMAVTLGCATANAVRLGPAPGTALPTTVTVAAGQSSTSFTLLTSTTNSTVDVTMTATIGGGGDQKTLRLAPANLRLTNLYGDSSLQLSWDSIATGPSFILKRQAGGEASTVVATLSNTQNSYKDTTGFTSGTAYTYELYDTLTNGMISNRLSATKFVPYKIAAVDNQTVDSRLDLRYAGTAQEPFPFINFPFGSRTYRGGLFVGTISDPAKVSRSFALFNALGTPPAGTTYRIGTVGAYCTGAYTTGNNATSAQVGLQPLSNTGWSGTNLTWSTAPTDASFNPASAVNGQTIAYNPTVGAPGWVHWPLQTPIYTAVTQARPLSVALASLNESAAGWLYFAKKEYDAAKAPAVLHAWDYPLLISLSVSPATLASGAGNGLLTVTVNGIGIGDSTTVALHIVYNGETMGTRTVDYNLAYNGFDRTYRLGTTGASSINIMASCNGSSASLLIN